MKNQTALLVFFLSVVLLLAHFVLTGLYSFQMLPIPWQLSSFSNNYSAPLFHQNWKLFAPVVPEYSQQLYVRYYYNHEWTEFQDVSEKFGFGTTSKVEYVEQHICSGLSYQLANNMYWVNGQQRYDRVQQSLDYGRAVYFCERMLRFKGNIHPDSLQMQLHYKFDPINKPEETVDVEFPREEVKP